MKNLICTLTLICFCSFCLAGNKIDSFNKTAAPIEDGVDKEAKKTEKIKMILDLDTGVDDAMALAYALADPKIELIGIVTSFGNVTMEESVRNSLSLLDMFNRKDIPVFKGADRSIGKEEPHTPTQVVRFIHGNNGIGNVDVPISSRSAEKQNGVDFMIESAKKYGKDLVIVAVGPTTNLSAAVKQDPQFKNIIGGIVIMGGALITEGNINHFAEANIFKDAIAANNLFTSGAPLTMVGLDVTQRTKLRNVDTQKWRELGTTSGKVYADMVDHYISAYRKNMPELNGCPLHDPLAVAVAADPDLVKVLKLPMMVRTEGVDKGRTIGIIDKMNDPNPNVSACVDIQVEKFVTRFVTLLTELFKNN